MFCVALSAVLMAAARACRSGFCAAYREAGVVLRLMLAVGFLADMGREDEMEVEGVIFEQDLPLAARTECMGFFVDRLEVYTATALRA